MWNNDRWGGDADMYNADLDGRRFPNNYGARNSGMGGPPSLFAGRPGSSISSSNQINSNLFDDYQSRSNSGSYRSGGGYNNSVQSGRINRNNILDYMRTRRILQKRALSSVGRGGVMLNSTMVNSTSFKRKRKPKPKTNPNSQESNRTESLTNTVKTEQKDKPNTEKKAPAEHRLAIVWDNDAKAILNQEQARLLLQKLEQMLDEVPVAEDGYIPRFFTAGLSVGMFKVVCVDQKSVDWLKSSLESLTDLWEDAKFHVIQQSEINSLQHVYINLIRSEDSIATVFKRLEKQNSPLNTSQWRLFHETRLDEIKRTLAFLIDEESLNFIKNKDWKLFLGLRQCKFNAGKVPVVTHSVHPK